MTKQLIEIRCPFKRRGKHNNKLYTCNRICVKVEPGSAGEAYCKNCRLSFDFEVDSHARGVTGVTVQKIKD